MATIMRQMMRQSLAVTQRSTPLMLRFYSNSKAADTTSGTPASTEKPPTIDKNALTQLVKTNKVVIFMKGNPEAPKCGFSNAVVQILRMHGVQYDAHDVLLSDDLRQGIKELTEWPTIPQVFINGEFVGGCDILLQMHQSGDLVEELKKVGIESLLLKNAPPASDAAPKDA